MRKFLSSKLHKRICKIVTFAILVNLNIGFVSVVATEMVRSDETDYLKSVERAAKLDFSAQKNDQTAALILQKLSDLELIREHISMIKDCMGDQIESSSGGQTISTVYEYLTKILDRVGSMRVQNNNGTVSVDQTKYVSMEDVEKIVNAASEKILSKLSTLKDLPVMPVNNTTVRQGEDPNILQILAIVQAVQNCLLDPNDTTCLKDRIKSIQCNVSDIKCTINDIDCDTDNILCNQVSIYSKLCAIKCEEDVILCKVCDIQSKVEQCVGADCTAVESLVEVLETKVDNLQASLLDCCATIETKIDEVNCSLLDCCTNLDTKIDGVVVTLNDCCATIESAIDELGDCCSVVDDIEEIVINIDERLIDVEAIVINVEDIVINIESTLDVCCSTIEAISEDILDIFIHEESRLDIIEACCNTVNSTVDVIKTEIDLVLTDLDCICDNLDDVLDELDCICDTVSTIDSKVDVIESLIESLVISSCATEIEVLTSSLDACCSTLNSKLDLLVSCNFITVPTTITAAGTYCLANNIVGASPAIVIASNDVVLNLEGYLISNAGTTNISGVQVAPGFRNIVIKNGSLEPSLSNVGTGTGIDLGASSSNVVIEDLFIRNWFVGINADTVDELVLANLQVTFNANHGANIHECSNVDISNSSFANNTLSGLYVDPSADVKILNSTCNDNLADGLFVGPGSIRIFVQNCIFNHNSIDGVLAEDAIALCLFNNIAKDNGNFGFGLSAGGVIAKENTATGNGVGFADDGTGNHQYYNNTACGNGTNYSPTITNGPVTSAANARGGANIDCANSTLDTVEVTLSVIDVVDEKLDDCCFTVESLLDIVNTNVINFGDAILSKLDDLDCGSSIDACCDTIVNGLNSIEGNVGTVSSKLDDCCSIIEGDLFTINENILTINSKIDALDCSNLASSLDACCAVLEAKIDEVNGSLLDCCITLTAEIAFVNDQLVTCCETLNSKLNDIEVSLAACCATIETKIDEVNSSFGDCCATLSSKLDVIIDQDFTILSKVNQIDTNVDTLLSDFQGTFTVLNAFEFTMESKLDLVFQDFQSTWTILGNNYDVSSDCTAFPSAAAIDAANLNVIEWLKTIYRDQRGFTGCI